MDAIDMLKKQHREVAAMFKKLGQARSGDERQEIFDDIADALALHAAIEERSFYRSVLRNETKGILRESVEEHLQMKRVIADLLDLDPEDAVFMAKAKVLQDDVEHHVEEEEETLFPEVRKLLDEQALETLGEAMEELASQLKAEGNPRESVQGETEHAAPL